MSFFVFANERTSDAATTAKPDYYLHRNKVC